jgi:peroxiredoxin
MLGSPKNPWPVALAAAFLCQATVTAEAASHAVSKSPRLLDLNGREAEPLRDARAKAIVFVFLRTDCPVSNRYAPEIRRIYDEFASRGVVFWLVYVDPSQSPEAIRDHLKEYDYHLAALRDREHSLVKITGAKVTPEVAVFAPAARNLQPSTGDDLSGQVLVYRGRIDDRYVDFSKMRPEATTHDLERVLQEILGGKHLALEITQAVGCFISDLK